MEPKLPDQANSIEKTGVLLLVVGPSGAGKDTLIDAAKMHFRNHPGVHFPKRVITRQDTSGEDHSPVSPEDFDAMLAANELFLYWEAHGLQYGVTNETRRMLERGAVVILNISRRLIPEAQENWPHTRVVQISVQDDILLQRLISRGRESEADIKARFSRRTEPLQQKPDLEIDNSGPPEQAERNFIATIESYTK